jgi:GNAT superfamily N-acetyltransferase
MASYDWRSLTAFLVQRITLPLFNVHYVFEVDLAQVETLPDTRRPLPSGVSIAHFKGKDEINPIVGKLTAAGMDRATLDDRMNRGDMVTSAFDATGNVIGYSWETFGSIWMREIRATMVPGPGEGAGLDTFVAPQWRGKGLQYLLNAWKFRRLAELGYKRGLNWVNASNYRSMKSQSSQGKRKIATIYAFPILNVVRVRKAFPDSVVTIRQRDR